jgi:hypothetical protein
MLRRVLWLPPEMGTALHGRAASVVVPDYSCR